MSKARELADLLDSNGDVQADALDTQPQLGRRNLIINGAMQVAQRGTSVTGVSSSGFYTVDRWNTNSSGGTFNMSQEALPLGQTDIPSSFKNFMRFEVTTGANYCGVLQQIEDVQTASDCTVTLSFYAKGSNPDGGKIDFRLRPSFGNGGSTDDLSIIKELVLTSEWTRYEYQFTLPSLSGYTVGTGSSIQLFFYQPGADNGTGGWTLDITGVQLELGSVATPFEHRSYGEELALCQRYYQKYLRRGQIYTPSDYGSNYSVWFGAFVTAMRAAPTLTELTSDGWSLYADANSFEFYRLPGGNYLPPQWTADAEL
jgi:hypothetical protein